jgi:hypothetical protein
MNNQTYPFRQIFHRFLSILAIVFVLISCQLLPTQNAETPADATLMETVQTYDITPPSLPGTFQTALLNPLDTPHIYTADTCRYLRNKWNPLNAEPGTVVMVIRIDEIKRVGETGDGISVVEFIKVMEQLKAQGFEAVTTKQFQAFMERNIRIPVRSLLIIQDGNHDAEYFERNFGEYWMEWDWPIVNGWVSNPELPESFVRENIDLEREGFVDHQAQGVFADTKLSDDSAKNVIARELQGSVNGFATHFGKNPHHHHLAQWRIRYSPRGSSATASFQTWFHIQRPRTSHVQLGTACKRGRSSTLGSYPRKRRQRSIDDPSPLHTTAGTACH